MFYFKKQSFWSRTCNHINMLFCVCSKEKNNAENNVAIYSFGCDFRMGSNTILFFQFNHSGFCQVSLLTKAFEIARDMFPLGAGFATFGSYYSGVYYSSVYAAYGLSNINGLRIGASQFISDSFWPMILGQSGYFGLFSYIFAVMMLLKAIQGIRRVENSYYAAAMSGICYLIIVQWQNLLSCIR